MQVVDRRRVARPNILRSSDSKDYLSRVDEYLNRTDREERPPRVPVFLFEDGELRDALGRLFGGNCAYCGIEVGTLGAIDQFRPVQGAEGLGGEVAFQHYCWLATDWSNLYLACSNCVREKRNRFPTNLRGPLRATVSQLRRSEEDTLLDPCWDAPSEHIQITNDGHLVARSLRGEVTIDILDLNRSDLVKRRAEVLDSLFSRAVSLSEKIESLLPTTQFSGAAWLALLERLPNVLARRYRRHANSRQTIRRLLRVAFADGGRLGVIGQHSLEPQRRRYVRQVRIKNFRGLNDVVLEFPDLDAKGRKGSGSLVVLGANGTGKTSLLQAAALGCLGPLNSEEAGIRPQWCLTDGVAEGEIEVAFWGTWKKYRRQPG